MNNEQLMKVSSEAKEKYPENIINQLEYIRINGNDELYVMRLLEVLEQKLTVAEPYIDISSNEAKQLTKSLRMVAESIDLEKEDKHKLFTRLASELEDVKVTILGEK